MCKILFISTPIGAGHTRAAQAVMKFLEERHNVDAKLANLFDFINPFLGKTVLNSYLKIISLVPEIYGYMYKWGNTNQSAVAGRELLNSYLAGKMQEFIEDYEPDVIVCTHATPAGLAAHLVKQKKINIPVVGIVTDFVVHRLWVYPELSYYFVAHEQLREYLHTQGIEYGRIKVTGIPVDESFTGSFNREDVIKSLNLEENLTTVMIMGGGAGVLPMDEIIETCNNIEQLLQFIVVTGNNTRMYGKLSKLQSKVKHRLKIYGFVNNINQLMKAAHLLISKPGGLTSSEALCSGLPMIIYRPIPGQEEANTSYLTSQNVAVRANSAEDIAESIRGFVGGNGFKLVEMSKAAKTLAKPTAVRDIATYIWQNYGRCR